MVNKTFSHYKIVKDLGRGGMAEVYEVIDLNTQEHIALKVLFPNLSSDEIVRKRFLREAKAGMELDHPGIVKVYEVGEEKKQSFIAMELVEGKTLDEVIREEPLDVERIINIGIKVADALAAAHKKMIIHRDIKPSNIMVSNGKIKVMDFGLVRIMDASTLTEKYEIVGTLFYMSPQQAIGTQIDERSDIFSLGVVLYQLLTGTLPFEGDNPGAIIHSILHSDPLRMEELREGISVEVEQVVFKAIQKKPQERYQSAVEFKSDLERVREILKGKAHTLIATEEVFEERTRGVYSVLVGRERELEILEDHLERMLKGEGSTILVRGEVGIGKSRLVWELGRKAKREKARYFLGRCVFGKEELPYQPILEVIRSYLELKGVRDTERLGDFIEHKAPHLTDRMGVIQTFLFMKGEKEPSLINKEQLWDTATELVKAMSQDKPILLHLDDLQWADLPTLNLLSYLSANTGGERILIAGTYRPEELIEEFEEKPHPLLSVLKRMRKEGLYKEINLERLDEEGTQSVISSVFPGSDFPESFAHLIYEETEGNPLFILEVLKLLRDEGVISQEDGEWRLSSKISRVAIPEKVNEVIMDRLRSLNREERDVVDVASVEGDFFQSDTLCHCLRLPRMKVLRNLQDLEYFHHLIHASEREYHFDHGKIREVAYGNLIPELKREYHRLIGEYFRENYGEAEEYAGKITHHLLEADERREALPYFIKAGEHAKKLFANEEAIGYFDKGIELVDEHLEQHPTPDLQRTKLTLLKGRAEVKKLIGYYDDARKDYEGMERLAQRLEDQKERAHGMTEIGETYRRKDDYKMALSHYEQALRIQRQIGDKRGEGSTLIGIGGIHYNQNDYDTALSYFEQSLQIQRGLGNKLGEGNALNGIGNVHYNCGNYERALSYFEQSLQIQRGLGNKLGEGNALNNIGNVHVDRGDYELALSSYEQSLRIKRQIGNKLGEANVLNNIGNVYLGRGGYAASLSSYEQSLGIQRQIGNKLGESDALNNIGNIYWNRGDYEMSLSYYEQSLGIRRQIGDKRGQWESQHYLCKLWLDAGDQKKALERLEEAGRIAEAIGITKMSAWSHIDTGQAKFLRSFYEDAHLDIQKGLEIAREMKEIDAIIEGLVVAAKLEIARRNDLKASQYAEEALSLAMDKGRKFDIAQAHLLLACISLSKGDLHKAESHASKAKKIAEVSGMKKLLWQAHHWLGRVFLKKKNNSLAQEELRKADQVVNRISSKLSEELRETYLAKKEIKEIYKDLNIIKKSKAKRGRSREKI